ncbi:LacI family DNA-binding transcriptional regulator [Sphaerisporangium fuscum]|uniref:LacI family DNA-binding transcriptional regulator n=1 Tax=Sphaerisporangium fuscum TaxID=2835868 RepID=UPI001BDC4283|nr:LacI family DNA-binding transcriptional regulator [Sphaerisporangium fuscum]
MAAHRPRGVSIEDVARAAGVSRQTVSNALNAPHRLRAETLERVTALIEEMGYRPDQSARSLRSGTRRVIAYTTPETDPANPNALMSGFLEALVTASGEAGYRILLVRPRAGQGQAQALEEVIAARIADAFLLSDVLRDDPRVDYLARERFPFVVFGRTAPGVPQAWVDVDSVQAMIDLVGLLAARGHRRLAFLGMSADIPWLTHRMEGFRAGVRRHRLTGREAVVDDPEQVMAVAQGLLSRRPRPTALVMVDDWLAPGVYAAAQAEGLTIGEDLAVTGFNDMPYTTLLQPPLTTVRLPLRRIADALVSRLLQIVEDGAAPEAGLLIPAEPVLRQSVPPARA